MKNLYVIFSEPLVFLFDIQEYFTDYLVNRDIFLAEGIEIRCGELGLTKF